MIIFMLISVRLAFWRLTKAETALPKTRPLSEADRLRHQADELYREGRCEEGLALERQALVIREKELGEEHPEV